MKDAWQEITINDREKIIGHFDEHPTEPIRVYVPASGSWCETFYSKEQYLARQQAHEDYVAYRKNRTDYRLDEEGNRLLNRCIETAGTKSNPNWWNGKEKS
jgi:hypothetical protein